VAAFVDICSFFLPIFPVKIIKSIVKYRGLSLPQLQAGNGGSLNRLWNDFAVFFLSIFCIFQGVSPDIIHHAIVISYCVTLVSTKILREISIFFALFMGISKINSFDITGFSG